MKAEICVILIRRPVWTSAMLKTCVSVKRYVMKQGLHLGCPDMVMVHQIYVKHSYFCLVSSQTIFVLSSDWLSQFMRCKIFVMTVLFLIYIFMKERVVVGHLLR